MEIVDPTALSKLQLDADPDLMELRNRFVKVAQAGYNEPLTLPMLLPLLLGAGAPFIAITTSRWLALPAWTGGLIIGLSLLPVVLVVRAWSHRRNAGRVVRTLLAAGRCPGCTYRLGGIKSVAADGMVVCPECSAAWLPSNIGAAPVEAASGSTGAAFGPRSPWGMMFGQPAAQDANGRVVLLVEQRLPGLAERLGDARAREVRRSVARATRGIRALAVVGWLLALGVALFPLTFAAAPMLLKLTMPLCGACLLPHLYRSATGRAQSVVKPTKTAMVAQGLCPSCAGDLGAESGARRKCGACGCEWDAGKK